MAKKRIIKRRRPALKKKNCFFCLEKKTPDFLEYETLQKYISERGKILARVKTGVCSKDQRRLTIAVKRARHLALLPFVSNIR